MHRNAYDYASCMLTGGPRYSMGIHSFVVNNGATFTITVHKTERFCAKIREVCDTFCKPYRFYVSCIWALKV